MKNDFIKIDLHIHTPESSCYKGPKDNDEYLKIIKKAKEKELKIVSITDHNSISGYKKIIEIKEGLERDKLLYEKISDSSQAKDEILKINEKLDIFKDIRILPGVEFETSNCIHMLLIFNDNTPISKIENVILESGYDKEAGLENPSILPNWDIIKLFEESKKIDCMVFDAHTDSVKGILNVIPKGKLRASCFSSDQLSGVCYKSEKQKDELAETIKNSREYQRKVPLAFVKFSDAHKLDEIGKDVTWVKVKDTTYGSLKDAFSNPLENICTEAPEVNKILNSLIKLEDTCFIENFSDENMAHFKKIICALNNTKGGYCLFGVNEHKNKIGVPLPNDPKEEEKTLKGYIGKIFDSVQGIERSGIHGKGINVYPLQDSKAIISTHFSRGNNLINAKEDNSVYILKNHNPQALSAKEIQDLIESRQLSIYEEKIINKIKNIEDQCILVKNYIDSIPIIKKFENDSILLSAIISEPKIIKDKFNIEDSLTLRKLIDDHSNGYTDGQVLFAEDIKAPRLEYAFLRITPPVVSLASEIKKNKVDEHLYLMGGGAVFYADKRLQYYSGKKSFCLELSSRNINKYSNKLLAAFLKSSFWLWYCLNKFESLDFFQVNIFNNICVPRINGDKKKVAINNIEQLFDEIINLEKEFLAACEQKGKDIVTEHNDSACRLFMEIDRKIYEMIGLNEEEINIIETCLQKNKIFYQNVQFNDNQDSNSCAEINEKEII